MATSILQGLGRLGAETGEASQQLAEERRRNAETQRQANEFQLRLSEFRQRQKQESTPKMHSVITMPDGGIYAVLTDPTTGGVSTKQLLAGAKYPDFPSLQHMAAYAVAHGDTALLKKAQEAEQGMRQTPSGRRTITEVIGPDGKPHRYLVEEDSGRKTDLGVSFHAPRASAETPTLPDRTVKALADKWTNEGIKPPAKYQAAVEAYMEGKGQKAKVKLTQQEQRLYDLTKQIEPKVAQLTKVIEDAGLANDNSFVLSNHSALLQKLRFYGQYKRGIAPEKTTADLVRTAAALQVMGAAPWMQMGRGKYMFETIEQHLPSPTDTPALLYQKAQFLQGIVAEAKASLPNAQEGAGGDLLPGESLEK